MEMDNYEFQTRFTLLKKIDHVPHPAHSRRVGYIHIYPHSHTHTHKLTHTHTYVYIYTHTHFYIYIYIYIYTQGDDGGVLVIIIGNGYSKPSSNPGLDCLHFTWERYESTCSPHSYG